MFGSRIITTCKHDSIDKIFRYIEKHTHAVNASGPLGETPLLICCERGFEDIVDRLINLGADIDAQDKTGSSPLMIAVRKHSRIMTTRLLKAGANVNARDKQGRSVLHHMAMCNFVAMLDDLIQRGAQIDAADSEGVTPLIIAFRSGFYDFGIELISKGADLSVRDLRGATATDVARAKGRADILSHIDRFSRTNRLATDNIRVMGGKSGNTSPRYGSSDSPRGRSGSFADGQDNWSTAGSGASSVVNRQMASRPGKGLRPNSPSPTSRLSLMTAPSSDLSMKRNSLPNKTTSTSNSEEEVSPNYFGIFSVLRAPSPTSKIPINSSPAPTKLQERSKSPSIFSVFRSNSRSSSPMPIAEKSLDHSVHSEGATNHRNELNKKHDSNVHRVSPVPNLKFPGSSGLSSGFSSSKEEYTEDAEMILLDDLSKRHKESPGNHQHQGHHHHHHHNHSSKHGEIDAKEDHHVLHGHGHGHGHSYPSHSNGSRTDLNAINDTPVKELLHGTEDSSSSHHHHHHDTPAKRGFPRSQIPLPPSHSVDRFSSIDYGDKLHDRGPVPRVQPTRLGIDKSSEPSPNYRSASPALLSESSIAEEPLHTRGTFSGKFAQVDENDFQDFNFVPDYFHENESTVGDPGIMCGVVDPFVAFASSITEPVTSVTSTVVSSVSAPVVAATTTVQENCVIS